MENGVILDHGSRFPLVIDPSGSAIKFLLNKYKEEKIQTTSFLDKAFTKTLAGAVRFGTTLLVSTPCKCCRGTPYGEEYQRLTICLPTHSG